MKVYKAHTDRALRVNLTDLTYTIEEIPEDWKSKYMGGRGYNVARLLKEVDPNCDPLGPENKLIFGAGPCDGTNMSGQRFNVTAKSPLTGILGDSNAGGHWGTELKYAGFDQLILEGRADRPIYIYIKDDKVEFRDAAHLWKKDPKTVHEIIRSELGDQRIQIACTGVGGDYGVKYAAIITNIVRANGRTGMGTVMASKNCKAVAVRGTGAIEPYDYDRYAAIMQELHNKIRSHSSYRTRLMVGTGIMFPSLNAQGMLNTKNNATGHFEGAENTSPERLHLEYNVKNKGCFGCVIPCNRYFVIKEGKYKGTHSEGPEFETLGCFTSRIMNNDLSAALKCDELCAYYGLDVLSTGSALSFSMELWEKGLINAETTGGLDLTWGNVEAAIELIHQIGTRTGFGDLLADGTREASRRLGPETEYYAMQGKGLDLFQAEVRGLKAYGLGNAVSSRGADHCRSNPFIETTGDAELADRMFGMPIVADRLAWQGKGAVVAYYEALCEMSDSLPMCKLSMVSMSTMNFADIQRLYSALTGLDLGHDDLMTMGHRLINIERIFNMLLGVRKKDDTLPERIIKEPLPEECGPTAGQVCEVPQMVDEYYAARGWDVETGVPLRKTLIELGLEEYIEPLEKVGLEVK